MNYVNDTICAVATPPGKGGIAIVRISGKDAFFIFSELFKFKGEIKHRYLYYGDIKYKEELIDRAMAVMFEKGASFTGEPVAEFHCHGGYIIAQKVIAAACELGARPALPGEFTKRSFFNGVLDLSQAEAVCDIINAESAKSANSAAKVLSGELHDKICEFQNELRDMLASIEASIDYPEEINEQEVREELQISFDGLIEKIKNLRDTFAAGRIIKDGIFVCIMGLPNAGKSSLINALTGKDVAIVNKIAGTTRDILHETIELNGIAVHLYDTAGLRETEDEIEKLGVERAYKTADNADVILYLIDSSKPFLKEDENRIKELLKKNIRVIVVLNKSDLVKEQKDDELLTLAGTEKIVISAKTYKNIQQLKDMLVLFNKEVDSRESLVITSQRHYTALDDAMRALNSAKEANFVMPIDCVCIDIKQAWSSLGEITGESLNEAIIDRIFEKFCLGK